MCRFQIAAKINPSGTSNSSQKRPLEDGNEPEAKKIAGGLSDGGGGGAGGGLGGAAAQAAAQAAAVAARIAAANANSGGGPAHGLGGGGGGGGGGPSMGPGMGPPGLGPVLNEDIKVPDKMVGLSKYSSLTVSLSQDYKNIFLTPLSHRSRRRANYASAE